MSPRSASRRTERRAARGASLVEIAVTLVVLGLAAGVALPALSALRDGGRLSAGGRTMAAALHAARWRAVSTGRTHGLAFGRDDRGWYWLEVADANGNGLRREELVSGVDTTLGAPQRLEERVRGVRIGIPAGRAAPSAAGERSDRRSRRSGALRDERPRRLRRAGRWHRRHAAPERWSRWLDRRRALRPDGARARVALRPPRGAMEVSARTRHTS